MLLVGFSIVAATSVPGLDLRLFPLLVVPVASVLLLVAALAALLALVDVFNRDLRYVLHNLLTVWFFLIPIVYDRRMVDGWVHTVTTLDPMRAVVGQFRAVAVRGAH